MKKIKKKKIKKKIVKKNNIYIYLNVNKIVNNFLKSMNFFKKFQDV